MGYYNSLALLVARKAEQELNSIISSKSLEVKKLFDGGVDKCKDIDTGDSLYIWDADKFSAEELDFMNELTNESLNFDDFLFIRVGESAGDVEITGHHFNHNFCLDVEQKIKFNKPVMVS